MHLLCRVRARERGGRDKLGFGVYLLWLSPVSVLHDRGRVRFYFAVNMYGGRKSGETECTTMESLYL